eukprot:1271721-Pyramimonas_sp.AAC.1
MSLGLGCPTLIHVQTSHPQVEPTLSETPVTKQLHSVQLFWMRSVPVGGFTKHGHLAMSSYSLV